MYTLYIGNKNYSSWSLRGWLATKLSGVPFREVKIQLRGTYNPDNRAFSPTALVPALHDGDIHVWDSLAISEYLAERHPGMWPEDRAARAWARSIAAEMHSGFVPLRRACPMNMWRPVKRRELNEEALANVRRIQAIWAECRSRYGADGPFLFGAYGAADAMYAPVVARFQTYDVEVDAPARAYMGAVMALPAWAEWKEAALKEPWVLAEDEVDWPTVLRI